jgi:hypothetical protein
VNVNIRDVYGPAFPPSDVFAALTKNKTMAYVDGWRKNGDIWQCFDHHMVGPSN